MKKKCCILLVLLLIINYIVPNYIYAEEKPASTAKDVFSSYGEKEYKSFSDTGESALADKTTKAPVDMNTKYTSTDNVGITIIVSIIMLGVQVIPSLLTLITVPGKPDGEMKTFSIENAVFNRVGLFKLSFFSSDEDVKAEAKGGKLEIVEAVRNWYYVIRNIAIVLSLVMLVYMGIRMAMSTTAEGQAKFKRMFMDWTASFIMLFVMHYIFIVAIQFSDAIVKLLASKEEISLEKNIIISLLEGIWSGKGWDIVLDAIVFIVMVFYQLRFFLVYMKRLFSTSFLIIISPLISTVYAMDKAGDNKAQSFSVWTKEILVNIFIQPIHAIIFMIFVYSAGSIMKEAPVVSIIMFMALSRSEKIVKQLFGLRKLSSISSIGAVMPFKGKK